MSRDQALLSGMLGGKRGVECSRSETGDMRMGGEDEQCFRPAPSSRKESDYTDVDIRLRRVAPPGSRRGLEVLESLGLNSGRLGQPSSTCLETTTS